MTRPFVLISMFVLAAALRAGEPAKAPTPPPVPTVIESAGPAEMASTATESTFTFLDKVVVTGAGLKLTCDNLVAVASRTGDPKATLGKQERFKSLVATGNVHLIQGGREAFCGRAVVLPGDDKVVLTENPRVRTLDGSYEASGPEMILLRGEQRAIITSNTRFVLPPVRDLGPGKKKDEGKKASPAIEPAPKVELPK
jgi:lipopolysaccharide export system protein LptA